MATAEQVLPVMADSRFAELAKAADQCPGYGMCRIDFLGTGVCPVGLKKRFAAYFPQGRMQVISAYRRGLIPMTRKLVDVALACQECGACDKQCYFVAGLRTLRIFQAFKQEIRASRGRAIQPGSSKLTNEIAAIVGAEWCSDDPAILASYSRARSPLAEEAPPRYAALPASAVEVAELVKLCDRHELPFVARGTATSLGGALTSGLIIDLTRMDHIRVDPGRWCASVGPGVFAFDLQREAAKFGMRANVAEPAASVCANVICTNMHSFLSYAYGVGADHYIDAEFVSPKGEIYRLSEEGAPNPFFFRKQRRAGHLGICTEIEIKLHPLCPDEDSVMIPCGSVAEAIEVAKQIARRRIGIGLGVIGTTYLSMFAAATATTVGRVREVLCDKLGIGALVLVLGDRSSLSSISTLTGPVLDRSLVSLLLRALPGLHRERGFQLITEREGGPGFYKDVFADDMRPLLEMALRAASPCVLDDIDEDLRGFFTAFFARNESSDPVWLNNFRILPARMGRGHQFVSRILYFSLDSAAPIMEACERLAEIGDQHGLQHGFGYLLPFEEGTRAVMEYDYYFDRTDASQVESMRQAMAESSAAVRKFVSMAGFVCSGESILMQGLCRPETYLFGR